MYVNEKTQANLQRILSKKDIQPNEIIKKKEELALSHNGFAISVSTATKG